MSQTILKKRYKRPYRSPFDMLLENSYDEGAWRELFGNRLDRKICHVVIREYGVRRERSWKRGYREDSYYSRRSIAYC